jgi:tRNA uridine 5-carboxymethylaminomethyl modification enzyme
LRADNADQRLTPLGIANGLVGEARKVAYEDKMERLESAKESLNTLSITPSQAKKAGLSMKQDGVRRSAMDLLSLKDVNTAKLSEIWPELANLDNETRDQVEKDAIYVNYIDRQQNAVNAMRKDEKLEIPDDFSFKGIPGLSNELQQKLITARPSTLAQAGRIEGMTPAALALILTTIRRTEAKKQA